MALSAEQYQGLIIASVGDNATGVLSLTVPLLWEAQSSVYSIRLRYLYTYRDAITFMQGQVRNDVSFSASGDLSVQLGQRFDHLAKLFDEVEKLITQELIRQTSAGTPKVGNLLQTQPIFPPSPLREPDLSRRLRGDPYNGLPSNDPTLEGE